MKYQAISMFSGAMGLDLGLEKAGIEIKVVVENEPLAIKTIKENKPDLPVLEDVLECTGKTLLKASGIKKKDLFLICGGPPCQAFSTAGNRKSFQDKRGNVFLKFIDLIGELTPPYILIENVRGLLSAPLTHRPHTRRGFGYPPLTPEEDKGGALMYILKRLENIGYKITFTLYDSANYGVPQKRERVILLGTLDHYEIPLIKPTHSKTGEDGLKKWRTVKDAIGDLDPKNGDWIKFPEKRLKYYRLLKSGQYWKNLPEELQKEALGASFYAGGGKTGFLRRLDWEKPSPTLVTHPAMPATDLCHPNENRPLSVQEYARIQMFPDEWKFCGKITDIYRQIGNAVPVGLAEAAGKHLIQFHENNNKEKLNNIMLPEFKYSRYKNTDHLYFKSLFEKKDQLQLKLFENY